MGHVMINIEQLAKEALFEASADPLKPTSESITRFVAHRVIEHCIREVLAVQVSAPDADIVKEKINARLRQLAAEVRK